MYMGLDYKTLARKIKVRFYRLFTFHSNIFISRFKVFTDIYYGIAR